MNPWPPEADRDSNSSDAGEPTPTTSASDGTTLPLSPQMLASVGSTSLAGATLGGRYRVLRLIARGGMGAVYEAHDTALDRRVALKTVHLDHVLPPDAMQRFRREALAAAQLDHPNIVAVYDFGDENGLQYFTMALVDGPSLTQFVRDRGPLTPEEAVQLLLPIVDAVGYAHQRQFIHRDLKPDNVLLDSRGRPRVTDFGLARHLLDPGNLTGTSQLLGTPRYMAPEQARNQQSAIGPATDVYAVGGILGYLLSDRPPIAGETLMEALFNVVESEPTLPRDIDERVPVALNEICRRCLAKNPADRFATTADLSAALRAFVAGDPTPVIADAPTRPSSNKAVWVTAAAVLLIALGIGGWALLGDRNLASSSGLAKTEPLEGRFMPPRLRALTNQLKDESAEVRATAAEALAKMGPLARPAIPALIERIQDDVWTTGAGISRDNATGNTSKDAAVAALQGISGIDVERAVLGATESKNANVRSWAAKELGSLAKDLTKSGSDGQSRRAAALARQLKDEDSSVRHAAATSLGDLGDEAKPAVPALIERIGDDVWSTGGLNRDNATGNTSKDAALAALKKLAPDKVDGALVKAAASKNAKVKAWASAKLAEVGSPQR